MDFRTMKRKELQALCKEHKIPANLSNLEMANKLAEFFNEKKNSLIQGLINGQNEIASETESTNVVVDRKVKKVRFSPEHELIEFTRSRDIKRRSRRNSTSSRDSSLSVENVDGGQMNNENVDNLGRMTRSRGLKLMESEVNEKERGKKGVKCYGQKNDVAAVENFKDGEFIEDGVDKPGVMQLRGKITVQEIKNASKRGRKRTKDDNKTDKKALDNANDAKLIEEVVDIPGRLTRSRGKELMEDSMRNDKRRKVVEKNSNNNAAFVIAEADDSRAVSRKSLRTRGIEREGKLARGLGERVKNNEKIMVEPQILLRRSKRNMNRVGDSEILNDGTKIHENDWMKDLRRKPKLLAVEGSGLDAKSTGSKVDVGGGLALPIGEPIKQGLRRSNRRKNAIAAHENLENVELKEETENRYPLRSSVPQLGSADGVSKGDKKVLHPTGVMRRSRRKNLSFELVSGDETINTDAATENFGTEHHSSKPCPVEKESPAARKNTRRSRRNASKNSSVEILPECGVDSTVQRKNEARKRKRGPISGGDVIKTNNDSSSPMQSMRKERGREKAAPAAATGKVSDICKLPSGLKERNMLDASLCKDLLETGESFVNAEFSVSEGAESINNTGLSSDTNVETVISDVRLTSSKKIHRKKQDISIADSARNGDTRLINRNELANSDENAASRIAELKTDHTDNEKQISASKLTGEEKIHSSLEFDVKELIEENITDTDKNDIADQVFSQTEDSSCNNTIDHQVLLEGSIVSGNACFVEMSYSVDSISPCDQTDAKSDLEAAEVEADKQAQSGLEVVDGEVECVSAQEILQSAEIGCTNAISSPIICHNNDVDHLESSANISGSNNEDTYSTGEAGASESCDGHIGTTDFKSALQLKEPSPGKLARSLEGDNTARGDEIYSHKRIDSEVAENDKGGCLRDHETACNEDSEFRRPGVIPQDKGHAIASSDENNKEDTSPKAEEVGAFESCDGHSESTDFQSALQLEEPSSGKLMRSLEGDNIAKGDEIHTNGGIDSKVAEDGEGGCLRDHDSGSNEDSESSVPRIIRQDRGHEAISSDENNKEDTCPKAGEAGVFEFCDRHIESTDLKSALPLEEPSSGKLTRRLEGDNTAQGDEIYSHKGTGSEVAKNDDSRCLKDQETASNEDGEFILPEPFCERSARIIPQDRGHSVMNTDEHNMHYDALAVCPITISSNTSEINPARSHGAYHVAKADENYDKSVHSEVVEGEDGGSSRHQKSKCDEDAEYGVSNLFAAETSARIMPQDKAIFSREKSIKNFNKKGMFQDSPSEAPATMCTSAKIKLRRDHEADRIAEAEIYVFKDIQSELGEADEDGCLEDQMSTKGEDRLFGVSNLFDAERSAPSTPQGGSSLHEISPSIPNSVSVSKGIVSTISKTCEIIHKKAGATDSVQGREGAILQSNGNNELFNQADAHTNEDTYEPVERPKSPIADSIQGQDPWSNESETTRHAMAMLKTNGEGKSSQVAQGSNTDGDASDPNCGKDKGDMVDASITDVSTSMYYTISKIGVESLKELKFQDIKETEHECESPLAGQAVSDAGEESSDISSRSWTEFELNTLFGTTEDSVTPTRLNDTSCQGTEIATLTISVNNSVTSNTSSLTKKKKKMVVERGSEDAKTMSKNVVLQPDYEEASNNGFSLGSEENQLKLLFATPIKVVTPCKVDETFAHEEKLDNAAMFKECVRRMKESVVTQIKSDEKVGDSGNEFEYSLPVGNSLPHNGEDVTCKELNQAEGVELVNKCTTPVLSGSEYDDCEVSKQQLTENTCECMRETNFITEENEEEKIISLGQSCHYREATDNHTEVTDKDIISSSGALKNLDKVEGCTDLSIDGDLSENLSCRSRSYLKSEEELAQSSEVAVELSDAGFQNSDIQENGHSGYVDGNILRETSFDNFRGPMDAKVANISSFDGGNFVIEKGTSPSLFPKASYDDGEVAERKDANSIRVDDDPYHDISHTREETDNLRLSHDISDELHPNSKVSILNILSVSFTPSQEAHKLQSTLELQSTNLTGITTQNADTVDLAAEHGSSLCSGESDILSSMAMHQLLGDNENGDIEKSEARRPLFNLEYDVEKIGKEVAENSTEAIAQFSISKLQLEEKFVDSNNDIHSISDASASRYNEILKESDVADTIQEYIDSESSLCMDFDGSGASLPIDVLAHIDEKSTCKNGVVCESAQAIGDKPSVESLETERNLEESTLFMKPAPVSEEAVKSSPAPIDLLVESSTANKPSVEEKGAAITETFLISKEIETSSKQLYSTPKKNARTILIHGTPRKLLTTADMKENAPMHKSSNIGDFTTVRPAKRKALQDVQWR